MKTLKYILTSLLLVLCLVKPKGQEADVSPVGGLSFGIDLSPFIVTAFEPERKGLAFSGNLHFKESWFAVAEFGFDHVQFESEPYDYESNGSYLRLGFDYDVFEVDEVGNNDNILIGLRYGFAIQEHNSPQFTIQDGFWGDYHGRFGPGTVNSHWVEMAFGLRTEVLKNFYMGWSIRVRKILIVNVNNDLQPYVIPGYGHRDNSVNLGFTYTLEYQIPFKKRK